jgi:phage terminase large subunit
MVRDNITGEQVAIFRDDENTDECPWQIYGLAQMYNEPLFGPEINFNEWIVKAFKMLKYTNFYRRVSPTDKTHESKQPKYGWRTGPENRQMMITQLVQWTGQFMSLINDVETLNEMSLFTRQEKKMRGIWMGAEPGAHDDCVIALAVLLQICVQQSCEMQPDRTKLEGMWTRVELECAVKEGRIDRQTAKEYIETEGCAYESNDTRYKMIVKQGGSRYGRR